MTEKRDYGDYEVDDHPFDRGYYDRVCGHGNHCTEEAGPVERSMYDDGWTQADRKLTPATGVESA